MSRLTSEEKIDRARNRCSQWHRKMSRSRRCHWCGRPSSKEYVNACGEHIGKTRKINRESKQRQRLNRRALGLCVVCAKEKSRYGYETCVICGSKSAQRTLERREIKSVKHYDIIVDEDLITVSQASELVGVHRVEIHRQIQLGTLKLYNMGQRKYWLRLSSVNKYIKTRGKKLSNIVKCYKCGHQWSLRTKGTLRCPINGCRSMMVGKL